MKLFNRIRANWKAMTPSEKFYAVLKTITSIVVVGGTAYCVHTVRESRDLIDFAVSKVGEGVDVEVSNELVQAAIKQSAEQQVKRVVIAAAAQANMDISEKTTTEVKRAVTDSYDKIMGEVSDRVAKECEKVNRSDILDDVRKSATNKLVEKLDGNLDAITDEYTKNLNNMGKVYEALATKLERKA